MIPVPTQLVLALRTQMAGMLDNEGLLLPALQGLAGRELVCQGEMIRFWERYLEHLCDDHPWVMNAEPPVDMVEKWGSVILTAWRDKMLRKHGELLFVRPFDPARVPRCPVHNAPWAWFNA